MIMGERAITFFKGRCFFIEKDIFLGITWRTCSEGMNDLNFVIFLPQECTVIWSVRVERSKQHHRFGGFLIPPSFFFSSFLLPFFFPNLLQIWQLWRFQSGNCFFLFFTSGKTWSPTQLNMQLLANFACVTTLKMCIFFQVNHFSEKCLPFVLSKKSLNKRKLNDLVVVDSHRWI